MPINLVPPHILLSKHGLCMNVTKALIISFAILTASDIVIWKNADALLSSDLARLNSDYKLQTLQQKVSLNASPLISALPPSDFAFSYSFGIIGETNNTVSSEHNIYIKKDNEGTQSTNITFTLSEAQMQDIWTSIIETGFFQTKNNYTENCDESGSCVLVIPEHYSILKVTGNNSTHVVIAREGYAFPSNEEYQKFKSLVDEIDRMIVAPLSQENDGNRNNDNAIPSNDREPVRGFI
jgi:hypothetical protein